MEFRRRLKTQIALRNQKSEGGIALFMVIGAMMILALLVTEFTYVAQVNSRMAYDGLDQLKAFYLAKSAFKLSLLRLKAYQSIKSVTGGGKSGTADLGITLPQGILDKIWSFPIVYPIPTNLPGMTMSERDQISKFQKESNLEGKFNGIIESESSKFNINSVLSSFSPTSASPTPTPTPTPASGGQASSFNPSPTPTPTPAASGFDPKQAQDSLQDYLTQIWSHQIESDPDFANDYRDFKIEDLVSNILAWVDWTYESRTWGRNQTIAPKRAPFYSLSELHMIPLMDDKLYDLFSPGLTVAPTTGINVNKVQETTMRALFPKLTDEEVKAFFEFRDKPDEDHLFKKDDDFWNYVKLNFSSFRGSDSEIESFKSALSKRGLRLVVDETEFKISVQAQVNQATKVLEAWVRLTSPGGSSTNHSSSPKTNAQDNASQTGAANPATPEAQPKADPGLKVMFMRIL